MTAKEIIERYEIEVYKKRVVTEEYLTKEEIECGDYEFI